MRLLTIAAALLASASAFAGDTSVLLGGWSYHFDRGQDWNESHNMVIVEHKDYALGYMKNSYGDDTFMFFKDFTWYESEYVNFGWKVGGNIGYDKEDVSLQFFGIVPILDPYFEFNAVEVGGVEIKPVILYNWSSVVGGFKFEF